VRALSGPYQLVAKARQRSKPQIVAEQQSRHVGSDEWGSGGALQRFAHGSVAREHCYRRRKSVVAASHGRTLDSGQS